MMILVIFTLKPSFHSQSLSPASPKSRFLIYTISFIQVSQFFLGLFPPPIHWSPSMYIGVSNLMSKVCYSVISVIISYYPVIFLTA